MSKNGLFIISLDFELNWGVHDVFSLKEYQENLLGARKAIPLILNLFQRYGIHATWATVGMLSFSNKKELMNYLPKLQPNYDNPRFSPYPKLNKIGDNEMEDPFHFGKNLIEKIIKVPHQELATHTFSHFYCLEKGQTRNEFDSDLQVAIRVQEQEYKRSVFSIVFPRNQVNQSYLSICRSKGVLSYRGNEKKRIYSASPFGKDNLVKKGFRLADTYINLFGHHTYPISSAKEKDMINLRSSRFLRPYSIKHKRIERLKIIRIKSGMLHAAKNKEVFHLWWHPHNFGKNLEMNIKNLEEILEYYVDLKEKYQFLSMNMMEAASIVPK